MNNASDNKSAEQFLNTEGGKTKSNAIEVPSVTLPKGGGALKGIDEKFSVNAVNGTSSFNFQLPVGSPRGATPALTVSYSSGAGNGIFGLGWNLGLSSVKRKTDKGLPHYLDSIDSDTFLLSDAEDLVPEFKKEADGSFSVDAAGEYIIHEKDAADGLHTIRCYRPRIEGSFARIERWTEKAGGIIKWRISSKENLTTLYGWTADSVLTDPKDSTKIFEWLPEFMFDDRGNCCRYLYKKEDDAGFDHSLLHHKNRFKNGGITYANVYLEKVLYGNKTPYTAFGDTYPEEDNFLFSTLFDYGEYAAEAPYNKVQDWAFRPDAFSDYRAGFEKRTTRLCKRVMLLHHFTGEGEYEGLVKSLDFTHAADPQADFTYLTAITSIGYIKNEEGSYAQKALPSMEFAYQPHDWNREIRSVATKDLVHAPVGLDEQQYQFTDLYNEGLSGLLTEQANGWYYKHNLGNGEFAQAKLVTPKPSFTGLKQQLQLTDLDADGGKQLANFGSEPKGFFELDDDNEWQPFRSFSEVLNANPGDPNTRMLDLDGDGKADMLITEDQVFTWYPSIGRAGYGPAIRTPKPFDEEAGPHMVFSEPTQTIFLADMSGDGLTDLVRIRNGETCYWPNLGYGRFGAKVAIDNSPVFDHQEAFNPNYIKIADIDGSGTSDIIYLGRNKFTCYKNLSGNRFSNTPFEIPAFPQINGQTKVTVTDLLGNGVSCIVWSSPLTKDTAAPLRYIDLMNSKKPHILVSYKNNMGKETSLEYSASTRFYLEDKLAGNPWVTKLHFPVHCVVKTTTIDKVSGHQFVSGYRYHHGYYDHEEGEFRGFGMVEQTDTETFEHWKKSGATNITDATLHQEPVVSKTWQHTGAFLRKEKILNQFRADYWYAEMERQGFAVSHPEVELPDELPQNLSDQELREALRACKGMTLRAETFALDAVKFGNTEVSRIRELTPYSVATHNCFIEMLQPKGKNKHAVFMVKESEALTYSYERNAADPRIAHNLNIKLDEYGNVLESASVVYPRLVADTSIPLATQSEQSKTVITYTESHYTNDVISAGAYRLRLPSEVKTFELKGLARAGSFYGPADFKNILTDGKSDLALYHEMNKPLIAGKAQRRLIEHICSVYYNSGLTAALPLHQLSARAIPYERYQLAYTPQLLTDIYASKANNAALAALMTEGKFSHAIDAAGNEDSNWWQRSGITQFVLSGETTADAQARFFTPMAYTDPYGATTTVAYESYYLMMQQTLNALGNTSSVARFNFRTLAPVKIRDINGNFSEVVHDELGMVKAVALMGKGDEADLLTGFTEISSAAEAAEVQNFLNAPDSLQLTSAAKNLLRGATSRFVYDFEVYKNTGRPAVVAAILREEHFKKAPDSAVQISFEYSGGTGEIVMKKVQAEPGKAKNVNVNPDGSISVAEIDTSTFTPAQLRWIGNGRTIKNNKGNPVKQYESYFSVSHRYENFKELVETGVSPVMYYDGAGRLVKTAMPDGTFSEILFDSWKKTVNDANDTVMRSDWYLKRTDNTRSDFINDPKEQLAAAKAAKHDSTPNVLHFDTLGKAILSVEHNRKLTDNSDEYYHTTANLDVEGNLRKVMDDRGNTVMEYKYDMLGNKVYQKSMDAGQRWLLLNVTGGPLRTWDERNHEFQYTYDLLQRPLTSKVTGGDGTATLDHVVNKVIYGESLLLPGRANEAALQARNILGNPIEHYDTGGLTESPDYDFKSKPLATTRRLFKKYKELPNWINANLLSDLETDTFIYATTNDAMGRISRQETPDGSIINPVYNEAGLFSGESILHPGAAAERIYIKDINYNEKGQREKIIYGNDVITRYYYDKETFRLKRLESKRQNNDPLQDWHYTFDAVGNITAIEDKNVPVVFFSNQKVAAISEYTYDALYRLAEASGRENTSSMTFSAKDNWNDIQFMQQLNPGDPMSVRSYIQSYQYDHVGNILEMKHLATGNNWTRAYTYETANNRLKSTQLGSNTYQYATHLQHGFITEMPHLEDMGWNFKEELVKTIRQKRTDGGTAEITYYQYDSAGQRIRKITENQAAPGIVPDKKEERIYIAGYELYKKHSGTNAGLERVSLSLIDQGQRFVTVETRNQIDDGTEKELVRYKLHNHLGSAGLELDLNAQVITYEEYHPFGTTAFQAKNSAIKSTAKQYRFIGMERDEETGLEYHSARYYLSWLGRWCSSDPIGIGDGINLYAYTKNNPIILTDKSGHQAMPTDLNDTNPNNPLNYVSYRDFASSATGPYNEQGLRSLWNTAHPDDTVRNPNIYTINRETGRADRTTYESARSSLGQTEAQFERAIGSGEALISRNGRLSITTQRTVNQINDPSSAPDLMEFGIRMLQRDTARYRGSFPADYNVTFGRAVVNESIRLNGADDGVELAGEVFGSEDHTQGMAALHLYEALARNGEHTGFDKVQHFVASAVSEFENTSLGTDIRQYGKEIIYDEIPSWFSSDVGYDSYDMLANNRGQAFGAELFTQHHPTLDAILNPAATTVRTINEVERSWTQGIYRLYMPSF
ncbi:SpvB/TcaC N-terminal domain-containing protein [Pedobacter psychroterrae]|uniref:Insecticidal toxin complex protein n=1 Tax=Pedobacter psychroterrae TaxID=2530453 RepID=A0A4R0NF52_9SPHI|nr:SpvB/TcaC N-terminal domain-containing protein [Pedobacter psychroterrae]TCC99005.1 insecticidal toxin complex protein [Pedobacter psychroterrae]